MKIFISQPMQGKSNEEIENTRKAAVAKVIEKYPNEKVEIIDSFMKDMTSEFKPLYLLGKAFQLLSEADVAFFAKGWDNSRGCKMEHMAASEYGITIVEE